MDSIHQARLAQSVEHQTLNRRVVGSSPTVDKKFFILYFVASDALLAGRLAPCKWNQAWRPSELYMYIEREREKVDFKSREVNCLKECALALSLEIIAIIQVVVNVPVQFAVYINNYYYFFYNKNDILLTNDYITWQQEVQSMISILMKVMGVVQGDITVTWLFNNAKTNKKST